MRLFLVLLLLTSSGAFAQDLSILLTHSQPVDPTRYDGVKGSPYFFQDFVRGNIISNSAETFSDMTLNYNAETKEFEIITDDKTLQLYKANYMRVEIYPKDNPALNLEFPIIFQRGFNIKWYDKFGQMVYDGDKIKLVKDYSVGISVNEVQNVGNTVRFKRFDDMEEYFLLIDGELKNVKLKKKRILSELEHPLELEKFAKENKIDFGSEEGVRKLLAFYETIN